MTRPGNHSCTLSRHPRSRAQTDQISIQYLNNSFIHLSITRRRRRPPNNSISRLRSNRITYRSISSTLPQISSRSRLLHRLGRLLLFPEPTSRRQPAPFPPWSRCVRLTRLSWPTSRAPYSRSATRWSPCNSSTVASGAWQSSSRDKCSSTASRALATPSRTTYSTPGPPTSKGSSGMTGTQPCFRCLRFLPIEMLMLKLTVR